MDPSCGLGTWFRPTWLQQFATARSFLVVYGLLGTIQSMAYIYFVATLTTLEKRFKIPSRTMGIVMSGNEVSQILLSLTLSYYGGRGHRPLWVAWGVGFCAASCFVLALPHIVYGAGVDALALTAEYLDAGVYNVTHGRGASLCMADAGPDCGEDSDGGPEDPYMPLVLVFLSQFVLGVGTTLYYALGQTYLDDNSSKERTPMLLGWVLTFRTIGPAIGFLLGFLCLSMYIDPSLTPVITKKDPRWLGAWWLGWLVLGGTMMLFAVLMAMFPRNLPRANGLPLPPAPPPLEPPHKVPAEEQRLTDGLAPLPRIGDFTTSLKRLLRNKLLMCNNVSGVFYILGASGYITFSTKYMETQYGQSAAGANIVAGSSGLLAMVAGFLISGFVISRFKPRPKYLLGWNVFVGTIYVMSEITFNFLGCPDISLHGQQNVDSRLQLTAECNTHCDCSHKYTPVCWAQETTTFYSACHAGCVTSSLQNSSKVYGNCSCIPDGLLTEGPCQADCAQTFLIFIALTWVMHSLGSSGRIGNLLVNYRSVAPVDKSFAQGLSLLMISLFAFIPGPIIYGAIIDSACLVWDESCGQKGNCWLYHKDNFRIYLNLTAAVLTTIGVLLDAVVWYLGQNLDLYGDNDGNERPVKMLKPKSSK